MRRCCFDHRDAGRTHACLRHSGHRDQCRRAVRPGRRRGRLRASRCLDRRGADRCRANRRCLALRGGCRCGLRPDRHPRPPPPRPSPSRLSPRGPLSRQRLPSCPLRGASSRRREPRSSPRAPSRQPLPSRPSLRGPLPRQPPPVRDDRSSPPRKLRRSPSRSLVSRAWPPRESPPARRPTRHSPGLRLCGLRHGADDGHHGRRRRVRPVRRRGPTSPRLREVCAARHPGRATAADRSARDHRANRRVTTLGCRSGLRRHADCRRCENPHGPPGQGARRPGPSRARSNGSGHRRCHPDARPRHRHHLSRSPDKDTNSLATATGACLEKTKKSGERHDASPPT